jgi:hypothetical protein
MSEHPIRIKSVNVHRNGERTHGMLETNDSNYDILLLQEPAYYSVATLRSDSDPDGTPQLGFPINNKWTLLSPPHDIDTRPKVCAYINSETIHHTRIVNHIPPDPLTSSNSMVIDLLRSDHVTVALRLVNVYHDKPDSGHALYHLFNNTLIDTIPTVLIGDFNSHSPRWSFPHSTPSSWAGAFHDWMDTNGLEILNPVHTFTWSQKGSRSSIIDLALANEQARYFTALSTVTVSWKERVSDHAALLLNYSPEESTTELHSPRIGFVTDAAKKDVWSSSFRQFLQAQRFYSTTNPETANEILHEAILQTCKQHLTPIKKSPPRGASWWNEDCAITLQQIEGTTGSDRTAASKAFRKTVREAKRTWAHTQLFETTDPETIWRLARVRKGRRSPLLPPLRDPQGVLQSDATAKSNILRDRFFPDKSNHVDIEAASIEDPKPLQTRSWPPINNDEVAYCLKDTKNKSAPGISGINYKLLKWAFDADPFFLHPRFQLIVILRITRMETSRGRTGCQTTKTRLQYRQGLPPGKSLGMHRQIAREDCHETHLGRNRQHTRNLTQQPVRLSTPT